MKTKLTVNDRMALMELYPIDRVGSFATHKTIDGIRGRLLIGAKESKVLKWKEVRDPKTDELTRHQWDQTKDGKEGKGKEFEWDSVELKLIRQDLEALDQKEELKSYHLPLFERFVNGQSD